MKVARPIRFPATIGGVEVNPPIPSTALASKSIAPGGTFSYAPQLHFIQTIGTDAQTDAQQSAEMRADIEATMRDLITGTP